MSIEYGVVVEGSGALSKAGMRTKKAAQSYLRALKSRGLLYGRETQILKIDNDRMQSTVVARKQNAGRYSKRKHKKFMKKGGFSGDDIQYVRWKTGPRSKRAAKRRTNPAAPPPGKALVFQSKAAAQKYARSNGLKGFSIRKNPGGAAKGAGAGGAGGGAGAGSQGGASRTEVRSPTRTATSTKAKTWGNITVTGGAGRGATTTVKIHGRKNPGVKTYLVEYYDGYWQKYGTITSTSKREASMLVNADLSTQHGRYEPDSRGVSKWKGRKFKLKLVEVKSNPAQNPLPVGKLVTVKARRRTDGRVEIYRA